MKYKEPEWTKFKILEELDAFATFMLHHRMKANLPNEWRDGPFDEQKLTKS